MALVVTGDGLDPDCSGNYEAYGLYLGSTYYRHCDGGWFIWYDAVHFSNISTEVGVTGAAYWNTAAPIAPPQDFDPQGTAAGIAHVAEP